jgi:hypothetical protein
LGHNNHHECLMWHAVITMYGNAALQKEKWLCGVRCNPLAQNNRKQHMWDRVVYWEPLGHPLYSLGFVTENSLFGLLKQHLTGQWFYSRFEVKTCLWMAEMWEPSCCSKIVFKLM